MRSPLSAPSSPALAALARRDGQQRRGRARDRDGDRVSRLDRRRWFTVTSLGLVSSPDPDAPRHLYGRCRDSSTSSPRRRRGDEVVGSSDGVASSESSSLNHWNSNGRIRGDKVVGTSGGVVSDQNALSSHEE